MTAAGRTVPGGWTKAPDYRDDPQRLAAIATATARDRAHYLGGGMTELECRACHGCVLVKKTSPHHTSVQWTAAARSQCLEFDQVRAEGGNPAMLPTCPRLSASIDHGVAEGIVPRESPAVDPDGYW
ncbi:MAG: hypothetical protein QM658_08645 [Gordonia sp. (in: high G+C Gram-positive bacteria)]